MHRTSPACPSITLHNIAFPLQFLLCKPCEAKVELLSCVVCLQVDGLLSLKCYKQALQRCYIRLCHKAELRKTLDVAKSKHSYAPDRATVFPNLTWQSHCFVMPHCRLMALCHWSATCKLCKDATSGCVIKQSCARLLVWLIPSTHMHLTVLIYL